MNYKLIEKLAKLANNNPNEHEANLAARKVCQLLAEADFKFIKEELSSPNIESNITYKDVFEMMQKMRKNQSEYTNPFKSGQYQPFTKGPSPHTYNQKDEKYYNRRTERGFGTEIKNIKCKKCKKIKLTLFTGLPDFFECNECKWSEY